MRVSLSIVAEVENLEQLQKLVNSAQRYAPGGSKATIQLDNVPAVTVTRVGNNWIKEE